MTDVLKSASFRRLLTLLAAAGVYVLAAKFPQFAKELAGLAALMPSALFAAEEK